jgi:hypothetical protein
MLWRVLLLIADSLLRFFSLLGFETTDLTREIPKYVEHPKKRPNTFPNLRIPTTKHPKLQNVLNNARGTKYPS